MALAKGSELPSYAATKQLAQPMVVSACPSPTRTAQASTSQR
jgi:hypothetical protein